MKNKEIKIFVCAVLVLGVLFMGFLWFIKVDKRDYSAKQAESRLEFGATYMTMNNPFFEIVDDEIRSAVEARGDVLITRDPALNLDKQIQQIREMIDRKVAAIFLNPVDWQGLDEVLEEARAAGIPVIAVDTSVSGKELAAYTVVSDNYNAGIQCARHLLDHRSGGNILLLEHPKAKSAIDRIQGFLDTIEENKEFHIIGSAECEGQLELAMPAMKALLEEYPDVDVVMALNDPSALGAMAALEDKGILDQVMVYGVDGSPEAKSMIAEGIMTATAAQFPNQIGSIAAERAYEILDGVWSQSDVKEELVEVTLVTQENVDIYGTDGWK